MKRMVGALLLGLLLSLGTAAAFADQQGYEGQPGNQSNGGGGGGLSGYEGQPGNQGGH